LLTVTGSSTDNGLMIFHYNNGHANAPSCYVIRTFPLLLVLRSPAAPRPIRFILLPLPPPQRSSGIISMAQVTKRCAVSWILTHMSSFRYWHLLQN